MCGRFFVPEDDGDAWIAKVVADADARAAKLNEGPVARGEVVPTQTVAALARSRRGQPGAFPMRWGFRLANGRQLINTRSETAADKPLFRESYRLRRCLVPASWYYEWERAAGPDGKPARRRYALKGRPSGPCLLAGIYRYEPGQALPALSILTREAAPEIGFIHDRMPVICPVEEIDRWLDPSVDPGWLTDAAQEMAFRPDDREDRTHA